MRGTIHARKTIRGSIGYPTLKGDPGEDGYSPQASVTKTGNTATITITDKSGTTTAQVTDGAKGDTGRTPEITANRAGDTTTIYSDSAPIAEIHDGTPGQDGDDGYSPSASVSKSGRIATITITDKTGTTTAQVSDGQDGTPAIIDATPTEDSPNAVSSGGVYDELSDVKSDLNQKYEKPSGGIPASDLATGVIPDVSGKADKVQNATSGNFASLDANGNLTDSGHKHSDYLTEAPVTDVQVDGASVVNNGVAEIPLTTGANDIGLVKVRNNTDGLLIASNGYLAVSKAIFSHIKAGTNSSRPIVPELQHESTFYGLAKVAGDSTQSASSNAVGVYTEEAQSKIHEMLDAPVTVSGTTPTITGKAGIRYICGEVSTLSITAPESDCIDVVFTSGSTPTVLTVTSAKTGVTAIKWMNGFDPTALDANTTYELNILDGELGVSGSWT